MGRGAWGASKRRGGEQIAGLVLPAIRASLWLLDDRPDFEGSDPAPPTRRGPGLLRLSLGLGNLSKGWALYKVTGSGHPRHGPERCLLYLAWYTLLEYAHRQAGACAGAPQSKDGTCLRSTAV